MMPRIIAGERRAEALLEVAEAAEVLLHLVRLRVGDRTLLSASHGTPAQPEQLTFLCQTIRQVR